MIGPNGDTVVPVELDVREHRFLRDHLVGGRPLLSTVMTLEAIGCAVRAAAPNAAATPTATGAAGAPIVFANVRVGPPLFLPPAGAGRVHVTMSAGPRRSGRLRSSGSGSDADVVHVRTDLPLAGWPSSVRSPGRRGMGTGVHCVGAEDVYAVFFHGPSFRVVDSAWFESGDFGSGVVIGRLAAALAPVVQPPRSSVTAPLLVELCLQTAGLWELAVRRRMMIPHSIERVGRLTDADSTTPGLFAVVTARRDSDGRDVFDAEVLDARGTVHLRVEGYRTTEFAHPPDRVAAERIRSALGGR